MSVQPIRSQPSPRLEKALRIPTRGRNGLEKVPPAAAAVTAGEWRGRTAGQQSSDPSLWQIGTRCRPPQRDSHRHIGGGGLLQLLVEQQHPHLPRCALRRVRHQIVLWLPWLFSMLVEGQHRRPPPCMVGSELRERQQAVVQRVEQQCLRVRTQPEGRIRIRRPAVLWQTQRVEVRAQTVRAGKSVAMAMRRTKFSRAAPSLAKEGSQSSDQSAAAKVSEVPFQPPPDSVPIARTDLRCAHRKPPRDSSPPRRGTTKGHKGAAFGKWVRAIGRDAHQSCLRRLQTPAQQPRSPTPSPRISWQTQAVWQATGGA